MALFGRKKVKPTPEADASAAGAPDGAPPARSPAREGEGEGEIGPTNAPLALRQRGCTDVCCIALFVAFLLGMAYLTYVAATVGDPYAVVYGADYLGNRCGRGAFANRTQTFYPRMAEDLLAQADLVRSSRLAARARAALSVLARRP
jgi:hypothetical protein